MITNKKAINYISNKVKRAKANIIFDIKVAVIAAFIASLIYNVAKRSTSFSDTTVQVVFYIFLFECSLSLLSLVFMIFNIISIYAIVNMSKELHIEINADNIKRCKNHLAFDKADLNKFHELICLKMPFHKLVLIDMI